MLPRPPRSTPFPYTTLFRSHDCELRSRQYRPRPDDGSGDSPRPPFLTEFVNHIGKLTLVEVVYHLFGGQLGLRVHPHVERSEEHTSELQSLTNLVCRLLLEK